MKRELDQERNLSKNLALMKSDERKKVAAGRAENNELNQKIEQLEGEIVKLNCKNSSDQAKAQKIIDNLQHDIEQN